MRYTREVSVGIFVVVALVVAAFGILAIGKESRLFSPKIQYWTKFPNITGLSEGAPVRLAGVQVGTVRRVAFPENLEEKEIRVELSVDRTFRERIRRDSRAQMRALTYLSIEKYIEISTGSPAEPPLMNGDFIIPDPSEFERLQEAGQNIAEDIQHITSAMRTILDAINNGEGVMSRLFFDKDFGKETMENIRGTSESVLRITQGIERREGLIGKLLLDSEYAAQQMEAIEKATARLNELLEGIQRGEGAIGDLFSESGRTRAAIDDFALAAENLRETTESLGAETGILGKLLHDEAYGKDLLERIQRITENLESISGKLDRGEGTLGQLLNDPQIYRGMQDVLGGIRNSRILSALIRKYGKRGARERVERALELLEEEEEKRGRAEGEE